MFLDSWRPGAFAITITVRAIGGARSGMLSTMVKWYLPKD